MAQAFTFRAFGAETRTETHQLPRDSTDLMARHGNRARDVSVSRE